MPTSSVPDNARRCVVDLRQGVVRAGRACPGGACPSGSTRSSGSIRVAIPAARARADRKRKSGGSSGCTTQEFSSGPEMTHLPSFLSIFRSCSDLFTQTPLHAGILWKDRVLCHVQYAHGRFSDKQCRGFSERRGDVFQTLLHWYSIHGYEVHDDDECNPAAR